MGWYVKPFFDQDAGPVVLTTASPEAPVSKALALESSQSEIQTSGHLVGRIAVYDSLAAAPRIEEVQGVSPDVFIEELSARVYRTVHDMDGRLPYTVLREVVENLIHARFKEPVVSVLDDGNTVRFSDQGPGIEDKERALLPGYTTASSVMKEVIRGVGSGLPLIREFLSHQGGSLSLEDNLGSGTVVTLRAHSTETAVTYSSQEATAGEPVGHEVMIAPLPRLSTRQKRVLSIVMEFGEAGPTLISKELSVGLSTAYRDLAYLEDNGLIMSDEFGKRVISDIGTTYLDSIFS